MGQSGKGSSKLVVVLGMHRSGTSAITRGLTVLGVTLGDRTIPANETVNPKGFWEDIDLNALNIELMQAVGHEWSDLSAISQRDVNTLKASGYLERAAELLQSKTNGVNVFGFKDPRVGKLLPFWQAVFETCGYDVSYVLMFRHPMSVARSLAKRDGFDMCQGYLLWLGHVIPGLTETTARKRVVIDYDLLMTSPVAELDRLAERLGLSVDADELALYLEKFLDGGLRHTVFTMEDLQQAEDCPQLVREIYPVMLEAAADKLDIDTPALTQTVQTWQAELERIDILFNEIDMLRSHLSTANQHVAEGALKLNELEETHQKVRTELDTAQQQLATHIQTEEQLQAELGAAQQQLAAHVQTEEQLQAELGAAQQQLAAHVQTEEQLQAELGAAQQQLAAHVQTEEQLQAELGAAQQQLAAHVQTEEQLQADLGAAQQQLAAHVQTEERLQADLNAAQKQLAAYVQTKEQLRADRSVTQEQLAAHIQNEERLQADLSLVHSEFEQSKRTISHIQHALTLKANDIAQMQASTLWRMTGALRYIGSRMPVPVHRQLRRGLKLAWWTVTPHRLPERLRFLRNRASQTFACQEPQSIITKIQQSLSPAPTHAFLGYQPPSSLSTLEDEGRYHIDSRSPGYVFVPRRRPDNLISQIDKLARQPIFSIVVPLYNTPDDLFHKMVGSVLAQWYPYWELILVDDKSPQQSVRDNIKKFDDSRIKTILLDQNEGISGATNRGLTEAQGDYIVFLDHDDELTDDCLFELAKCIAVEDSDYVYSDEDKIESDGSFSQPFYKPDWSPDTLMSTMYTCHVSCVRRSLLKQVGLLRPEFDGSQDWDFVLRVTEVAKRISHIPKILYHWRVIPQSVASDLNAKPYAIDAGRRARMAALERRKLKGTLESVPQLAGYFRVKYEVQGNPLVSIIIPSKNNGAVLNTCVNSILEKSYYKNLEIILIDNGSTDQPTLDCFEALQAKPNIQVIKHDAPFNYSEINNIGARKSKGDLLIFLNDDTEVLSPDWIERMTGYAQLTHVGAVGAKLLYPDHQKIQHCGILNLEHGPGHAFLQMDAYSPGYFDRNLLEYDWIAVTGACLMIERRKFELIGGFDEDFPVAYNDVDLCFRLVEHNFYNVVCPTAELLHYESLSRGHDHEDAKKHQRLQQERRSLYYKHPHFLACDPFHNPNLSPNNVYFSLN